MELPARLREGYGRGVVEIAVEDQGLDAEDLRKRLLETFRAPNYHPPVLPRVALELHELSRQVNVDLSRVAKLAESDPFTAAAVLRRAQSSYYSRGGAPVQSLQQAITRLGLVTISQLFLEVATTARIFRAPGFEDPMERLRKHASAVAHASAIIARRTSLYDEYAFLCGLLHDVGFAASMVALCGTTARAKLPTFEEVRPILLEVHTEAGEIMTKLWRFPPDIALVVGNHHARAVGGVVHPLAATLAIAEALAEEIAPGFDEGPREMDWALRELGLEGQIATIRREVTTVLSQDG